MIDEQEERYRGSPLIERVKIFVIQWMALELMKKNPGRIPLGCYVVEHDSSFFADKAVADRDTIYTTLAPECFLDEAISCYPMLVRHRKARIETTGTLTLVLAENQLQEEPGYLSQEHGK